MSDTWTEGFDKRRAARKTRAPLVTILDERLTLKPALSPDALFAVVDAGDRYREDPDKDLRAYIDTIDEAIIALLDPGSLEAWARLRDPSRPDPLDLTDLREIHDFLCTRIIAANQVPTDAPTGSSGGRKQTARKSTGASSSTAAK